MASLEQIARAQQEWNRPDADNKSIRPPIEVDEAEAFLRYGIRPEDEVQFAFAHPLSKENELPDDEAGSKPSDSLEAESERSDSLTEEDLLKIWTVHAVLVACSGIRNPTIPGYNPDLVAKMLLDARKRAAGEL